jgi:hypothetical protein
MSEASLRSSWSAARRAVALGRRYAGAVSR